MRLLRRRDGVCHAPIRTLGSEGAADTSVSHSGRGSGWQVQVMGSSPVDVGEGGDKLAEPVHYLQLRGGGGRARCQKEADQ